MNQRISQILFALLRSAVYGGQLKDTEKAVFSEEMLPQLLAISRKHDVAHLLAVGIDQNALISEQLKKESKIEHEIIKVVYRYELLNAEYQRICKALETAEIPFLPLKGSVIRKDYPEAWMRTSCDIDILVHKRDVDKAISYLCENHQYVFDWKGPKDVSLFSPSKQHIELHYSLMEDDVANSASEILQSVWDKATPKDGYNYWYEMPDEMFYFYHIAHMAKHFENGGCGIRPFIDITILDNIDGANIEKRNELLEKGNLLIFAEAARNLSKVWFSSSDHDEVSQQMENYILRGGVYGTTENRVAIQQQKKGGRLKYLLSRLFIPYDEIKYKYPILEKHRILTPFMEIHRILKMLFSREAKNKAYNEMQSNQKITSSDTESISLLLRNIGL